MNEFEVVKRGRAVYAWAVESDRGPQYIAVLKEPLIQSSPHWTTCRRGWSAKTGNETRQECNNHLRLTRHHIRAEYRAGDTLAQWSVNHRKARAQAAPGLG